MSIFESLCSLTEGRVHKQGPSRKGCMKGKGGPENASCTYIGVRQRAWGKWVSETKNPYNGKRIWLGTFNNPESAAMAYDKAVSEIYGADAKLNFPERLHQVATTAADIFQHVATTSHIAAEQEAKSDEATKGDQVAHTDQVTMDMVGGEGEINSEVLIEMPGEHEWDEGLTLNINNGYEYEIYDQEIKKYEQFIVRKNNHFPPLDDHDQFQFEMINEDMDGVEPNDNNENQNFYLREFDKFILWDEGGANSTFEELFHYKDPPIFLTAGDGNDNWV